jgi:dihydrofolate synthase/folylpolyglutamate synthase
MRNIENFKQANDALSVYISVKPFLAHYTLDTMRLLMNFLGNPQDNLRIIHVAGTSGKTSTSYYVASLLKTAGYRVGLSVSPHINEVNERAQIDMLVLPENEYCRELGQFLDIIDGCGIHPSYFELLVAFAFWLFDKRKVDYAVVEVGLGGLLDGTNVINRSDKVCLITDIGFDHTEILGDTLSKIATQKAGIIQTNNHVFMHPQDNDVMSSVQQSINVHTAELTIVYDDGSDYDALPLFQKRNFSLALASVTYVLDRDYHMHISDGAIALSLQIVVPARMQIVTYHDKMFIFDGSHNAQKVGALVDALLQQFPAKSTALLVSFGLKKRSSVAGSLQQLRRLGSTIVITQYKLGQDESSQGIDPEDIATQASGAGFTTIIAESDPQQALRIVEQQQADIYVVTGSFYLLNHYGPLLI